VLERERPESLHAAVHEVPRGIATRRHRRDARHQEFEAAPRERLEELLLRAEQDIHGTRRRSGLPGDIADGDGLDAALGDQQLGGGYRS
jgi:hypothetical protein